jgi:hypothetical protein
MDEAIYDCFTEYLEGPFAVRTMLSMIGVDSACCWEGQSTFAGSEQRLMTSRRRQMPITYNEAAPFHSVITWSLRYQEFLLAMRCRYEVHSQDRERSDQTIASFRR